ncbi:MAG TPA: putative Ig domain-containing protein [Chitinophagaceae bacterium]|jgi:acetyl esterase/lipase|nr:putative Ig domain-containing protein [Chitinophagaceae bacterium]
MRKRLLAGWCALCLFTGAGAQIDYKGFPEWSWQKQDSTEYYLYTPREGKGADRYPIVLFLHGCCGTSYTATLRNTVDPPVRMWHGYGANRQTEPTYILAPATSQGWKQHIPNLKKVMDSLVEKGKGDPRRIYITGFSMGAEGTWEFLQQYPDYFAAALPMGMDFHGDPEKIRHIPIWTLQGETDWYARRLKRAVQDIRKRNGIAVDSNATWLTGVNPRYTNFAGLGHGVQWPAVSTQDLTGWAYAQVNDGNRTPSVYFLSPDYGAMIGAGTSVRVKVAATDPEGKLKKVALSLDGKPITIFHRAPYEWSLALPEGDHYLEAIATDEGGKSNKAVHLLRTDIPVRTEKQAESFSRRGAWFEQRITVAGNQPLHFSWAGNGKPPAGLHLSPDGILNGIPEDTGTYTLSLRIRDADGDTALFHLTHRVKEKHRDDILVRAVQNDSGFLFPVTKLRVGVAPQLHAGDDEVTISNTAGLDGLTLIPGNLKDTGVRSDHYLTFHLDEPGTVFIAYEQKDHLQSSTIPGWLQSFRKIPSVQLAAQYYYFNLYSRDYPAGTVYLPGGAESRNEVTRNYFVLVRKTGAPFRFPPEINILSLPEARLGQRYQARLTALYGSGHLAWKQVGGTLPAGLRLSEDGSIAGTPVEKKSVRLKVEVKDASGSTDTREFFFVVK